ncbi:GRB2-associated-binding protein 2 [Armadillidium vulgare]|nr:GRB2-associated-binding protein 2 [Armadillidium vulgare]
MFDIKTPKRVFYLCAETEEAMNRWVDCVCQVCGLKVMSQEDMIDPIASLNPASAPPTPQTTSAPVSLDLQRLIEYPCVDSPPPSASSTVSGPYIPISECITGKKNSTNTRFPFVQDLSQSTNGEENQRLSIPNEVAPPAPIASASKTQNAFHVQRQNSNKGAKPRESYDVPRHLRPPPGNSETSHSIHSPVEGFYVLVSEEEKSLANKKENISSDISDAQKKTQNASDLENPPPFAAPPRPPKPAHLAEVAQQSYMNLAAVVKPNKNSLNSKGRRAVVPPTLLFPESSVSSSDPEPSPASVTSSTVSSTSKNMFDDLYDLPRSHQAELVCSTTFERSRRHCYNNSAPLLQGKVFSYDLPMTPHSTEKSGDMDPRISPLGIYSNIPQSNNKTPAYVPPAVDRGLKPKKVSDTNSCSTAELSPPPSGGAFSDIPLTASTVAGIPVPPASAPPVVDRNLKPHKKAVEPNLCIPTPSSAPFVLDPAPRSKIRSSTNQRKPRAAPSPTPPSLQNGSKGNGVGSDTDADSSISSPNSRRDSAADEQIFFPLHMVQRRSSNEIQYLDLDLDSQTQAIASSPKISSSSGGTSAAAGKASGMSKIAPAEASVVYKKVDFVKTEAFNKMRQNVEEGYRTGKTSN